jgi:hypothetical protein
MFDGTHAGVVVQLEFSPNGVILSEVVFQTE